VLLLGVKSWRKGGRASVQFSFLLKERKGDTIGGEGGGEGGDDDGMHCHTASIVAQKEKKEKKEGKQTSSTAQLDIHCPDNPCFLATRPQHGHTWNAMCLPHA
jgi:hypothetical protein